MAVKLVDVLVRKDDLSYEEFVDYWLNEHMELVRQLPNLQKATTSLLKDLHGYETTVTKGPEESEYDGIIELYFEDVDDMFEAFHSETGQKVHADVGEFLDGNLGPTFVVDETVHEPEQ